MRRAVLLADSDSGAIEFFDTVAVAVLRKLRPRPAEGVGGAAVRAGKGVLAVDVLDDLRRSDVEQLGAVPGGHPGPLQHGPHSALEH